MISNENTDYLFWSQATVSEICIVGERVFKAEGKEALTY